MTTVSRPARAAAFLASLAMGLAALVAGPARAAPAWTVDRDASQIAFEGVHAGDPFRGTFGAFEVEIAFDPDDLETSVIRATIDVASAKTGDRQRDRALPGPDWFAARDYPQAVFESEDIVAVGEGAYEARGALTLRGVTRPLTLPFTLEIDGDRAEAAGTVTLTRTAFGVGQGEDFETGQWVALEVGVAVRIVATRAGD